MAKARNYVAGVATSTIFGFSFIFTKGALETLDLSELLFLRFLSAALLLSALALFGVIKLDYKGKDLRILFATALLQPTLYFLVETEGLKRADASTAGILLSAIPVTVTVLAGFILKERLRPVQTLTSLLSFAGVVLVVWFRASGRIGGEQIGRASCRERV